MIPFIIDGKSKYDNTLKNDHIKFTNKTNHNTADLFINDKKKIQNVEEIDKLKDENEGKSLRINLNNEFISNLYYSIEEKRIGINRSNQSKQFVKLFNKIIFFVLKKHCRIFLSNVVSEKIARKNMLISTDFYLNNLTFKAYEGIISFYKSYNLKLKKFKKTKITNLKKKILREIKKISTLNNEKLANSIKIFRMFQKQIRKKDIKLFIIRLETMKNQKKQFALGTEHINILKQEFAKKQYIANLMCKSMITKSINTLKHYFETRNILVRKKQFINNIVQYNSIQKRKYILNRNAYMHYLSCLKRKVFSLLEFFQDMQLQTGKLYLFRKYFAFNYFKRILAKLLSRYNFLISKSINNRVNFIKKMFLDQIKEDLLCKELHKRRYISIKFKIMKAFRINRQINLNCKLQSANNLLSILNRLRKKNLLFNSKSCLYSLLNNNVQMIKIEKSNFMFKNYEATMKRNFMKVLKLNVLLSKINSKLIFQRIKFSFSHLKQLLAYKEKKIRKKCLMIFYFNDKNSVLKKKIFDIIYKNLIDNENKEIKAIMMNMNKKKKLAFSLLLKTFINLKKKMNLSLTYSEYILKRKTFYYLLFIKNKQNK